MNRVLSLLPALICTAFCTALAVAPAQSQSTYPNRPVRMLVAFPPGGSSDIIARIISPQLLERLGKPFVVEYRPGAGGSIAAQVIAKAPADGHVLMIAGATTVMGLNSLLIPNLPYDPKELAPITRLVTTPFVVAVNPSMLPVGSVKELLLLLKAKPQPISFASGGNFSGMHLAGENFKRIFGLDELQHVGYKGNGPALQDLAGGQIPMAFVDLGTTGPFLKSGRIKVLAVAASQRSILAPDIPTTAEAGLPAWEALGSFGMFTTAGTPPDTINRVNAEVGRILRQPDVRERILATGSEPAPNTTEEYGSLIRAEVAKWIRVIKESGIKIEQ